MPYNMAVCRSIQTFPDNTCVYATLPEVELTQTALPALSSNKAAVDRVTHMVQTQTHILQTQTKPNLTQTVPCMRR